LNKGFVPLWLLAILVGTFLFGLTVYNLIENPIGNVPGQLETPDGVPLTPRNPLDIADEAAQNVPWDDVIDYFTGGVSGVLQFISKYIIKPLVEFIASVLAQRSIIVPDWLGFVITLIVLLMFVWSAWGTLWALIADNTVRVLIILAIVFAIGVVMVFLGVI